MTNKDLLGSWKEIAVYLERDIRTCMRWEKDLDLPVHRVDDSSSRAKVFAYRSEIDTWLRQRAGNSIPKQKSFFDNKRNNAIILAASLLLSLCLVTLYIYRVTSSQDVQIAIAIEPWEDPTSTEYDQLFTVGIMNDLVSRIMNLENIMIIPKTMDIEYKNSSKKYKNILKNLNADYRLRGKAGIEESNISIKLELIRVKDEKTIYNGDYQKKIEELHSIQQEIFQNICNSLNLSSNIKPVFNHLIYTFFDIYSQKQYFLNIINQDWDASLQLCLQGEKCFEHLTKASNSEALQLFREAIEMEENCARAHLGMARVFINYTKLDEKKDFLWMVKAEEFVKNAQAIEPDLPEYFSTLIEIYLIQEELLMEDKKELIKDVVEQGLLKYPRHCASNAIIGKYYFSCFGETGDSTDFSYALEMKKRAFLLNPFSIDNLAYTELLMLHKNYYNAIKTLQLISNDEVSDEIISRFIQVFYYIGDFPSCKTTMKQLKSTSVPFNPDLQLFQGMMATQEGNRKEAQTIIRNIHMRSREGIIKDFNLKTASIYFGLDNKEKGFQYLDTFFASPEVKKKFYIYLNYIEIDKNFDRYQEDIFSRYKRKIAEQKY